MAAGELPVAAQAKLLARKEHRESRQRRTGAGFMNTGFVTVIDDSAFGQLADPEAPPRDRGPRAV